MEAFREWVTEVNSKARKKIMHFWGLRNVILRRERKKNGEANEISPSGHCLCTFDVT